MKDGTSKKKTFTNTLYNKSDGYTLIELLVVIVIATLLFGFAYASYRGFAQRQALLATARIMEGDIRKTQNFASSSYTPASCSPLDGYLFEINTSDSSYSASPVCGGGKGNAVLAASLGSTYSLSINGASSILFKPLGVGTNIDSDLVIVTITQVTTNNLVYLDILKSGEVRIRTQ